MSSANILTRDLEENDFNKGYLSLLSQLTKVGDYAEDVFKGTLLLRLQICLYNSLNTSVINPRKLVLML